MKGKIDYKRAMIAAAAGLIFLFLLFVDQVTKGITDQDSLNVKQANFFLGIVRIYSVRNPGMAFSWFAENPVMMVVITVLTVVMIAAIAILFFTLFKQNVPAQFCLAVIEAGAVGNLIDRLCLGYVRDFIDVSPLRFGICNPADFFITFGAIALVVVILFIGKTAVFPLTKKWRAQAKEYDEEKERKKAERKR